MTDTELISSPNVAVRHLAFFRAASAEREGSNEYETLLAGLLVLRLLDKRRVQAAELLAVRKAVDALDDSPIRRILSDLVDAIKSFTDGGFDTRIPKLIAYAQMLEHVARWDPAADVYQTAIETPSTDRELLPMCYQRAGICLRKIGYPDRAAVLFREGKVVAADNHDQFWSFKLRMSEAVLEFHAGDLPEAERQLDTIIADAVTAGDAPAAAEARHERGQVALERDQHELAAELFYTAMKAYADPVPKLRAMHDLATALADLGHLAYARTVLSAVRNSSSMSVEMQNLAILNLMRVAVLAGEEVRFNQLRREVNSQHLTGRQQAHYRLFVGQGYLKFGETDKARVEFAEAVLVAQKSHVYRVVIEADELLKATPEERPARRRDAAERAGLVTILDEIRNRRGEFAEATE